MANVNDFRRRRLAAKAGNPERESWWRYARWRTKRILAGVTVGLLITIYLIARFGFSVIQETTTPDWDGPIDPNTGRRMYVGESIFELALTVSPVPETPVPETPVAEPPLH